MSCFHPLEGWRSATKNKNGKRDIVFNVKYGIPDMPVKVPCGRCVGCRMRRSRQWATRCVHEAMLHDQNTFITLTYNDDNLPPFGNLCHRDFQLFMKKLRKKIAPKKIKFYMCGEYGDNTGRPHYHACIFGYQFPDLELWSVRDGVKLYRSSTLESLWTLGNSSVGEVTFNSAAYVARYIMKKITGDMAQEFYSIYDDDTGEVLAELQPEYTQMSRGEAIGKLYYEKYKSDLFPSDFVIHNGEKMAVPSYYLGLYELDNPKEAKKVKARRKSKVRVSEKDGETSPDRLAVKEKIMLRSLDKLKRNHDKC